MREADSGIKLTAEVRFPNGEVQTVQITSNVWDADGEQMGEFFRQLMAGMGFAESTIASVFNDDEDLFDEMNDDLADRAEDSDEFNCEG